MLTTHDLRRIAVEAGRDPRTVAAALSGRASPLATAAVRAAAMRLGFVLDLEGGTTVPQVDRRA